MRHKNKIYTILLCIILCACGKAKDSAPLEEKYGVGELNKIENDFESVLMDRADSILYTLTLEQRIGQCFMPSFDSEATVALLKRLHSDIIDLHIGGILLMKGDLTSATKIAREALDAEIPLFVAIDAEWGLGMRLSDAPRFPMNGDISPEAEETILFDYGREMARECRNIGINMVLGPVVDVSPAGRGIIGKRSFGEDPRRVAEFATAYALGLESGGVLSVAKHFPGHGATTTDTHRKAAIISHSSERLDTIDLLPFKSYIANDLSGIMMGHIVVPSIDSTLIPATVSEVIIQDFLRKRLGFHGLVLTDAMNMGGAKGYSAVDALKAGADIIIGPADISREIKETRKAIENGALSHDIINDHVRRILFYKQILCMDEEMEPVENLKFKVGGHYPDSLSRTLRIR